MGAHAHVCGGVGVHVHVCAHFYGCQRTTSCVLQVSGELAEYAGWPLSPSDVPGYICLLLGLHKHATMPGSFTWDWGIKSRPSHL